MLVKRRGGHVYANEVLKMKPLYAECWWKRLQWVTFGYKSWPCSAQSNHVAYMLLMQHTVRTNCADIPLATLTYTKTDTHTPLSPPLCLPATHCNFPSSSLGQTTEQLICVLAVIRKKRERSCICAYSVMRYTFNLMCQECENSDRCGSSFTLFMWQQQSKPPPPKKNNTHTTS